MERYKELQSKVEDFFTDHNIDIKIYFVDKNGHVTIENLNSKKNMQYMEIQTTFTTFKDIVLIVGSLTPTLFAIRTYNK